jgi:hypothetical protein
VPRSSEYILGTELTLLSVRALCEFSDDARVTCNKKLEMPDWDAFGLFGKYRVRRCQRYLQKGKQRSGRHSPCQGGKCAKMGTTQSGKHFEIWGKVGYGAGKQVMNCEKCTEYDKEERTGKGCGSEGCRGAEHGQACTKDRIGAVTLRAALESDVLLGRGDEVNRQTEMANPKCRDSLQAEISTSPGDHMS